MNRKIIALMPAVMSVSVALSASAEGANNCAPHELVVDRLAAGYGESRQSIALGSNNSVVEIFASMDTGSWTITMTQPGGPTCLVASGLAFEHVSEALPNLDPPA